VKGTSEGVGLSVDGIDFDTDSISMRTTPMLEKVTCFILFFLKVFIYFFVVQGIQKIIGREALDALNFFAPFLALISSVAVTPLQ